MHSGRSRRSARRAGAAAPEEGAESPDPLTRELEELVSAKRHGDAVEHFHSSIGVPVELVAEMRSTPEFTRMEAVAHTLVYDCLLAEATTHDLVRSVEVPTLVLDSEASTENLTGWAAAVASLLPRGRHLSLEGQWRTVPDDTLALVLVAFFRD